jgi:hypothetical protein
MPTSGDAAWPIARNDRESPGDAAVWARPQEVICWLARIISAQSLARRPLGGGALAGGVSLQVSGLPRTPLTSGPVRW